MSSPSTFRAHALVAFSHADHHRKLANVWQGEREFDDQMRIVESYMKQGEMLLTEAKHMEAGDE